jgi:hypothetical protein
VAGHFFVRYNDHVTDSLLVASFAAVHNPWHARMHLGANTAVGAGGILPFSVIDYDPAGMCTTGAAAKVTVPMDGYYFVSANAQNITTAAVHVIGFSQNGSVVFFGSDTGVSGTSQVSSGSGIIKCAAGDTIQVTCNAATTVVAAVNAFFVTWIAPA